LLVTSATDAKDTKEAHSKLDASEIDAWQNVLLIGFICLRVATLNSLHTAMNLALGLYFPTNPAKSSLLSLRLRGELTVQGSELLLPSFSRRNASNCAMDAENNAKKSKQVGKEFKSCTRATNILKIHVDFFRFGL
jgi:hypothetical protein